MRFFCFVLHNTDTLLNYCELLTWTQAELNSRENSSISLFLNSINKLAFY